MWFIGLLLGLVLGGTYGGFSSALSGALLGAIAGLLLKSIVAQRSPPPRPLDVRVQSLENRIDELNRAIGDLQGRLSRLEPARVESAIASAAETISPSHLSEPDTPPDNNIATTAATTGDTPFEISESLTPASVPEAVAPTPSAAAVTSPPTTLAGNTLWTRLIGGNVLAKIGVVLLFFGIASGLKLAAQYGLFPIQVRLLIGAVAAIAMIAFGWNRVTRPEHRMFGLALQGGGFAILYLIVFFMLTRYQMIDVRLAFLLFMALGVGCVILAAIEDGMSLAVLGISGAFMAPVLAATSSGNHVLLFSYYALLNTFIIGVNWVKGWRALNVCGFLFTFVIGMVWGIHGYRSDYLLSTEAFLILFSLMYSLAPVAFALLRAPGMKGWTESTVVFGVPIAAAFTQSLLMRPFEYGLAWSALIAGIYYLVLWSVLLRRHDPALRVMERSHLAIAIVLLTLAIPLAFGVTLTGALWALEGAVLVWLGTTQNRKPALFFGLLLQLAAGLYFLSAFLDNRLLRDLPLLNSAYTGELIFAAAGSLSAWFIRRAALPANQWQSAVSNLALAWGLFWWFGAGSEEIDVFVAARHENAWLLGFTAASVLALEGARRRLRWRELGATALLLTATLVTVALLQVDSLHHVFAGAMLLVFPLALAVHHWILASHEKENIEFFATARHLVPFWLVAAVLAKELDWLAYCFPPNQDLWQLLAWGIVGALALLLVLWARKHERWPVAARPDAYLRIGLAPVAVLLAVWSVYANLSESGAYGLAYLPLLNPFDLVLLLVLFALLSWARTLTEKTQAKTNQLALPIYGLGFIWVSMMSARLGYYWADVPFRLDAMFDSVFVQSVLSLLWTTAAIALMITATRRQNRGQWFLGFALLGLVGAKLLLVDLAHVDTLAWTASLIGVALLVLAASYFSPAPPKTAGNTQPP